MHRSEQKNRGRRRPSFTLVELMVVMVIIALIASFVLRTLAVVRDSAKGAKTRATITKIDKIIMAQWESYQTRRVPVDAAVLAQMAQSFYGSTSPTAIARARLNALRDLIRMEMPDRWGDLCSSPANPTGAVASSAVLLKLSGSAAYDAPAATYRFLARFQQGYNTAVDKNALQLHDSEKCLYMIVMNDPESAGMFNEDESKDLDGDGLRMFIDGWERPIKFIRWPAGFLPYDATFWNVGGLWGADTDIQTNVFTAVSNMPNQYRAPDPFNPMKVVASAATMNGNAVGSGFALYPLIYSAGPDGAYDVFQGGKNATTFVSTVYSATNGNVDPYASFNGIFVGQPENLNSSFNVNTGTPPGHFDNIHNHRLELR